ncbi:hypothetical protein GCM10020000_67880 [Streptomyces olivoverticillatus]
MSSRPTPRRTVLGAALAVTAAAPLASATSAFAAASGGGPGRSPAPVDYRAWATYPQWSSGKGAGTRVVGETRPGLVIHRPIGTFRYTDPHTDSTATWEYATWLSPVHTLPAPASEVVVSWNARTPAGTWLQTELRGSYTDGTRTPWYVMGRWTSGDGPGDIRRTSVDGQGDKKSSVSTDTLAVDDRASGLRIASYELRLTLFRKPGTDRTPQVWRLGAMASDVPDRFTVPASRPGEGAGHKLRVPRYSQEIHKGQYPEYDNGGARRGAARPPRRWSSSSGAADPPPRTCAGSTPPTPTPRSATPPATPTTTSTRAAATGPSTPPTPPPTPTCKGWSPGCARSATRRS